MWSGEGMGGWCVRVWVCCEVCEGVKSGVHRWCGEGAIVSHVHIICTHEIGVLLTCCIPPPLHSPVWRRPRPPK